MSDSIGAAIVTHLETVAEVTAVVGSGDAARIYPSVLPQDPTYPAIVYTVASNTSEEHLGGSAGLSHARVRIDCYATTAAAATALAEIIRINGLPSSTRGAVGSMTVRGVSLAAGPFDDIVTPRDGGQQWLRITRQDFLVSYKQATP